MKIRGATGNQLHHGFSEALRAVPAVPGGDQLLSPSIFARSQHFAVYVCRFGLRHMALAGEIDHAAQLQGDLPHVLTRLRVIEGETGMVPSGETWLADWDLFDDAHRDSEELKYCWDLAKTLRHPLRKGMWPAWRMVFQAAIDHGDDSPATRQAEEYWRMRTSDWNWLRLVNRREHVVFTPLVSKLAPVAKVRDIQPLPNGKVLVVGDVALCVCDPLTGLCELRMNASKPTFGGLTRDGRILYVSEGGLYLWSVDSGKHHRVLPAKYHVKNLCGMSEDIGLVRCADGAVLIGDVTTGAIIPERLSAWWSEKSDPLIMPGNRCCFWQENRVAVLDLANPDCSPDEIILPCSVSNLTVLSPNRLLAVGRRTWLVIHIEEHIIQEADLPSHYHEPGDDDDPCRTSKRQLAITALSEDCWCSALKTHSETGEVIIWDTKEMCEVRQLPSEVGGLVGVMALEGDLFVGIGFERIEIHNWRNGTLAFRSKRYDMITGVQKAGSGLVASLVGGGIWHCRCDAISGGWQEWIIPTEANQGGQVAVLADGLVGYWAAFPSFHGFCYRLQSHAWGPHEFTGMVYGRMATDIGYVTYWTYGDPGIRRWWHVRSGRMIREELMSERQAIELANGVAKEVSEAAQKLISEYVVEAEEWKTMWFRRPLFVDGHLVYLVGARVFIRVPEPSLEHFSIPLSTTETCGNVDNA